MSEIIAVPQFQCRLDEILAVTLIRDPERNMFVGIGVGLRGLGTVTLVPQSVAAAFIDQLHKKGFYDDATYSTVRAYIDRLWDGKTDLIPGQTQKVNVPPQFMQKIIKPS